MNALSKEIDQACLLKRTLTVQGLLATSLEDNERDRKLTRYRLVFLTNIYVTY